MLSENDAEIEEWSEDSVFLPIADLFSLLSLTVIYVVLTFGQTAPTLQTEPVVAATLQGSGPGRPIDAMAVYVSLSRVDSDILFEITRNGIAVDKFIPLVGNATKIPKDWILEVLARGVPPSTIYVYLLPNEEDFAVKALFTDTQRFLRDKFQNVRTAL